MPEEQLSLSELNLQIKLALEQTLDPFYWVVAEIGEIRLHPKGHCYMELVEKDNEEIKAKIKANIWAFTYRKLSGWFEAITKESLKPGMKILCQAQVQFHPIYGLSLNIKDLDPNYTLGERARNRNEVINTLMKEGVFDMNKQWGLPEVIQRIAIISSETAAGYGDFMNQLRYNEYGYTYECTLFNASMQGTQAKESIIEAMYDVHTDIENYDILVLIRGGGASLDLDCFDTYDLAYHITQFPIPVITGIGHERDETVADMVAHTRLKTPTAVAEFIVNRSMNFESQLEMFLQRILDYTNQRFQDQHHELEILEKTIQFEIHRKLESHGSFLEKAALTLKNIIPGRLRSESEMLDHLKHSISLLDPERVLKRGYSITMKDGKILKKVKDEIKSGDLVETRYSDGNFKSIVK